MARNFNGSSDVLVVSAGALTAIDGGPITLIAVLKLGDTTNGAVINLRTSGGTLVAQFNVDAGTYYYESSGFQSIGTASTADNWHLIGVTKATGMVVPRGHKYVYDTNTWTHADSSGSAGDAGAMGAGGTTQFGRYQGSSEYLNADIALAGVWDRVLTDTEIEQLAFSLQHWHASVPTGLWVFDQQATSQKVLDLTGGGANESSVTGTAVSTNSVPVFTYGEPVSAPHSIPGGGGTTFPVSVSGSITPSGTLVRQPQKVLTGAATPTGALVKQPQRSLGGQVAPSGALLKLVARVLTGSTAPTSTLSTLRLRVIALAGSVTPSGLLTQRTAKNLSGASTPTGAIVKHTNRTLAGAVTPTGTPTNIRTRLLAVAGAVSPMGQLLRMTSKALAGGTTPGGQVARTTGKRPAGSTTPTGALAATRLRVLALAGAVTPSGNLIRQAAKAISGTVTPVGSVTKRISRTLGGGTTPAGLILKAISKVIVGSTTPSGAVSNQTLVDLVTKGTAAQGTRTTVSASPASRTTYTARGGA